MVPNTHSVRLLFIRLSFFEECRILEWLNSDRFFECFLVPIWIDCTNYSQLTVSCLKEGGTNKGTILVGVQNRNVWLLFWLVGWLVGWLIVWPTICTQFLCHQREISFVISLVHKPLFSLAYDDVDDDERLYLITVKCFSRFLLVVMIIFTIDVQNSARWMHWNWSYTSASTFQKLQYFHLFNYNYSIWPDLVELVPIFLLALKQQIIWWHNLIATSLLCFTFICK